MAKNDDSRTRQSIPISGLDTATPDMTVADGKCEELHNLRWAANGWHDVKPLSIKHWLSGVSENFELFQNLTIVYHHPAAGNDVYIASAPNDDGTINLCQVVVKEDTLVLQPEGINPLYIYERKYRAGSLIRFKITAESLRPVASDVAISIYYKVGSLTNPEISSTTVTILKNQTSSSEILDARFVENENTKPIPGSDDVYSYPLFRSKDEALLAGGFFAANLPTGIRLRHFGNILLAIDDIEKQVLYYLYANNIYSSFNLPAPPVIRQSVERIDMKCDLSYTVASDGSKSYFYRFPLFNTATNTYYPSRAIDDDGRWHGEICCFVAFQMVDGTIASPSGMLLFASELDNCNKESRAFILSDHTGPTTYYREICNIEYRDGYGGRFDHEWYVRFSASDNADPRLETMVKYGTLNIAIKPTLHITIPNDIDTKMIDSIVVYSTRINPIYDTEKMVLLSRLAADSENRGPLEAGSYKSVNTSSVFADNKLPEQPFYKVKELNLKDIKDGNYSLDLTYDLLRDIQTNSGYDISNSLHTIYFADFVEYNNRAHIYNTQTTLFEGYTEELISATQDDYRTPSSFFTIIEQNNTRYVAESNYSVRISKFGKLLTYPDWRATQMLVFEGSDQLLFSDLTKSVAMNMAYKYRFAGESEIVKIENAGPRDPKEMACCYVKYPCFAVDRKPGKRPQGKRIINEPSKMQASALNNPFVFPYANSYAIGSESNQIYAVNSAVIEMSDAKFGEFPLYVFTEEGVFAMQSGRGEVLYSATIPLNYDRIINPHTLAVNQNVLYITDRGIHALFSNQSKLISEPLNDLQNLPPLEFLRNARMCYQHPFSEVIVWDDSKATDGTYQQNTAFVYSLGGGYWSTRDFEGTKLNTDEIFARKNAGLIFILDLNGETARLGNPSTVRLVTRPIKLGSAEFKRLETFIPRLFAEIPLTVEISFEASVDQKTWIPLRKDCINTDHDFTLRRFPFSVRYLRISLEAIISKNFELTRFDIEYYLRFLHRLR